ncbi:MAG: hypothetical protein JXB13_17700 [Phycisphaerae bacterium]|nr:hypothetical protein [Phycisphaerae bacterium]
MKQRPRSRLNPAADSARGMNRRRRADVPGKPRAIAFVNAAASMVIMVSGLLWAAQVRGGLVARWELKTSLDDQAAPASKLVRQVGEPQRTAEGMRFPPGQVCGLLCGAGANRELCLLGDFTWWVRASFGPPAGEELANHDTLLSRWGRPGDYSALLRSDGRTGTLHLFLSPDGRMIFDFDSAYTVDRGEKLHDLAAVVRAGKDVTFYIDGRMQCTLRFPPPPPVLHDPAEDRAAFAIGYNSDPAPGGDHESFNGLIHSVRVYDEALSASAIRGLSGAAAEDAGPRPCVLHVHATKQIGRVHPFVFGHFLEHFQDVIYGGVVAGEPGPDGGVRFHPAVIDALRALGPSVIRWPGGNFTSAYHWRWGAVPLKYRPTLYEEAVWKQVESNLFGTPELLDLCERTGATPVICVGVGRSRQSPTPEEAAGWVRYCNATEGPEARLRREAGRVEPFDVRIWGLGNEVYGSWQVGYYPHAADYAHDVMRYATAMRQADPRIQFVVCGDSYKNDNRPWNRAVLTDEVVRTADWISYHSYTHLGSFGRELPYEGAVQKLRKIEQDISELAALNREVSERAGRSDVLGLAVDEWNEYSWGDLADNARPEIYHLGHALFTAGFLNVLLRHCDVVTMANYSPSVNCRGLIAGRESAVLLRATYPVFELYRAAADGMSVPVCVDAPMLDGTCVPVLDAVAVRHADGNMLLYVTNRSVDRTISCRLELDGFSAAHSSAIVLTAPSPSSFNDGRHPRRVAPREFPLELRGSLLECEFEPHSLTVLRLGCHNS